MILIPSSVSTYQESASFSFFLSLISKNIDTTVKIIKMITNSVDIYLVNIMQQKVKIIERVPLGINANSGNTTVSLPKYVAMFLPRFPLFIFGLNGCFFIFLVR